MEFFIILVSNGDIYEGEIKNYKCEGYGKCYFINGDRYEGTFSNGYNIGYGIFYSILGIKYESYFKPGIYSWILFSIYKILLFLDHLRDIFINNKISLLFIVILIIGIILN